MNWKCCFKINVIEGGAANEMMEVENGLSCKTLTSFLSKQVNFGLEINGSTTFAVQN